MKPQAFDQETELSGKKQDLREAQVATVTETLVELFELLEDYAPVWYTEEHHHHAVAALRLLTKS